MIGSRVRAFVALAGFALIGGVAQPVVAQDRPVRVWADIDTASTEVTQAPQIYTMTSTEFAETSTRSVSYGVPSRPRALSVGVGAFVFHGLGGGVHFSSTDADLPATIAVSLANPAVFGFPQKGSLDVPLPRHERTLAVSVVYAPPLPKWLGVRLLAGRTRLEVRQAMIQSFTATRTGFTTATIDGVSQQSEASFAWGTHFGFDAETFPLKFVGVGVGVDRRSVDLPGLIEPYDAKPFAIQTGKTTVRVGLRVLL